MKYAIQVQKPHGWMTSSIHDTEAEARRIMTSALRQYLLVPTPPVRVIPLEKQG